MSLLSNIGSAIKTGAQKVGSAVTSTGSKIVSTIKQAVTKPKTSSSTPTTSSSTPTTTASKPTTTAYTSSSTPYSSSKTSTTSTSTSTTSTPTSTTAKTSTSTTAKTSSSSSSKSVSADFVKKPSEIKPINTNVKTSSSSSSSSYQKLSNAQTAGEALRAMRELTSTGKTVIVPTSTLEKQSTPRLSGLGVPSTPTLPGDTKSKSEPTPGVVMTAQGGVSTAFPDKYKQTTNLTDIFSGKNTFIPQKPLVSTEIPMPTQSFSGRIDPQLGIKQVEKLQADVQPYLEKYNKLTAEDLSPIRTAQLDIYTKNIEAQSKILDIKASQLQFKDTELTNKLNTLDLTNQAAVDSYNKELRAFQKDIANYNNDVQLFGTEYKNYQKEFDSYNSKVQEAQELSNYINTRNVMAKDITSNINLSLVPPAIKEASGLPTNKYGVGGTFEHPFLSWKGQGERVSAAGRGIFLGAEAVANPFPKDKTWGKVGNVIVSPLIPSLDESRMEQGKSFVVPKDALHNEFVRDTLEFAANNPAVAAGSYVAAPGLVTTVVGGGLVLPTVVGETFSAGAESGKLSFITGVKEPLFTNRYTPEMDVEARTVLLSNIPEATLVPRADKPGSVWKPGAAIMENINLGFTSNERLQQGATKLFDYYKQQGLTDIEAYYRISKLEDSLKVSNQREWLELASAGVATNIVGGKGVSFMEQKVSPYLSSGGVKAFKVFDKIPIVKQFGLQKGAEKYGIRYLASRFGGMAPAGALEGAYFTASQKELRTGIPATVSEYGKGAVIGAVVAPLAQTFIERKMPITSRGGAFRPPTKYTTVFSQKLNKPTEFVKPTGRESGLFAVDPLEPVSDVVTDLSSKISYNVGKVFNFVKSKGAVSVATKGITPTIVPGGYPAVKVTTPVSTFVNTYAMPTTNLQTYTNPLAKYETKNVATNVYATAVDINPYTTVKTEVTPYVDTTPVVDPVVRVTPSTTVNIQPYIDTTTQLNTQPNTITSDNLPPVWGWLGDFGSGTEGRRSARGSREWVVQNKIATYGEDWMARQQAKTSYFPVVGTTKTGLNIKEANANLQIHPQNYAVVNRHRVVNTSRYKPTNINISPYINNIEHQQKPQLTNINKITPRERAQNAVERGFGKVEKLDKFKINNMFKVRKQITKGMI